ncbi:flavin reductase family protein [Streptomyces sp. NPDC089919]|uniref:flavin reductase family protein n=1 Tax=Streptomyces sp. NPDC089919 TaxID=3155188 RepID=UPI0034352843
MELRQRAGAGAKASFTEAMAHLAAGVAVVSVRRADGRPAGLLVSSVSSYSVEPPSVLLALARSSRTRRELDRPGTPFGVHLLGAADAALAQVFAGRGEDKFADVLWEWDGPVPRLAGVPVYLTCRTAARFPHGDHVIVVGEVTGCALAGGEPLVYYRRRLDWRLRPGRGPAGE